jgi:hypothetical protein
VFRMVSERERGMQVGSTYSATHCTASALLSAETDAYSVGTDEEVEGRERRLLALAGKSRGGVGAFCSLRDSLKLSRSARKLVEREGRLFDRFRSSFRFVPTTSPPLALSERVHYATREHCATECT